LTNRLATETSGKKEDEKENQELRGKLDRTRAELKQEKEHFETLKAHSEEERNQAVQDVVARLRTDISRALENISLFADREQPNRQGILASVSEIKRALDAGGK
jgi:molecular chaperone GrpE (heat shock protein)